MTQFLRPLYGEYFKDLTIAQAIPLPPGVYAGMVPSIAGAGGTSGWTVNLSPDPDGFSYWRTPGIPTVGRYVIQETAAVQLPIAPPDPTYSRIDLVVGLHKWVQGPVDPSTLEPTGEYLSTQQATYIVAQGLPAAVPAEPTIPDPYDGTGTRAVVIAKVTVPPSGTPAIEPYAASDLRLVYMRAVVQEVVRSRGGFADLPSRLDSLASGVSSITKINAVAFQGATSNTGSAYVFTTVPLSTTSRYGSAVLDPVSNTIGLGIPGLYEVEAFHKMEGTSVGGGLSCSSIRAWLTRDGTTPQLLDSQLDTNSDEVTETLYAMIYVDPTWTNVGVYFERSGWPAGTMRGSVKYLGDPTTLEPLGITTGDLSFAETAGATFPDSAIVPLVPYSPVGAVTWQIISGAGLIDGTTTPQAAIVNGNQLQIAWATAPTSYPATNQVKLQVTDSATPPRTAQKTLNLTLSAASPVTITTPDQSMSTAVYPLSVSFQALASGGAPPYTWAVVAGADTTLPGAAISGTTVSGSVPAAGGYTVRLRATDSASTQVEKVVNITVATYTGGGGGGGCVPAGTPLSLADGATIPIEQAIKGLKALAFDDLTGEPVEAVITDTWEHPGRELYRLVTDRGDLVCSHDHRLYCLRSDGWVPARELSPGDTTLWLEEGLLVEAAVERCEPTGECATVYHLTLDQGHIYVAGGVPAHNKIVTKTM